MELEILLILLNAQLKESCSIFFKDGFFLKLSNYYPIKYQNYFSILSNKKIKFQYVNGIKIKSINLLNFKDTLNFISKKIKLKRIKK